MKSKYHILYIALGLMLIIAALSLTSCGQGKTSETEEATAVPATTVTTKETEESNSSSNTAATEEPASTPEPKDLFPESLVIHPDAFDIEASPASGTYVYVVPMMVKETTDYLITELKAKGWEELGQPTIMGHLATINLKMGNNRLSISLQDNERSQTTRVQLLLLEQ